jgi:hypothetical protein
MTTAGYTLARKRALHCAGAKRVNKPVGRAPVCEAGNPGGGIPCGDGECGKLLRFIYLIAK